MVGVKKREFFVYFAIILYCVGLFLKRVNLPVGEVLFNKMMTLGAVLAVINIFWDYKMEIRQMILTAVIGGLLFVDSVPNGNHEVFYLFLVIWGCRNTDSKKVMKLIFYIVLGLTILNGVLTYMGVVNNELFIQDGNRERYGLGYSSWTILPFQFLSLCMMLLYFTKKIRLWIVVSLIGIGVWISILTDVKSACPFIVWGILGLYIVQYVRVKEWKKLRFLIFIPEFLLVFSLIVVHFYSKGIQFLGRINEVLNNRLLYPAIGLEKYGIRFFSNPEVKLTGAVDAYFVLDNSYLNLLLVWGIVGISIISIICSYLIYYCIEKEDLKLLMVVIVSLMIALMWSRLLVLIEMEFLICYSDAFMTKTKKKRVMSLECIKN